MDTQKLANVCQAVTHGKIRQVVNLNSGKRGTIVGCNSGELTVRVGGATEVWDYSICEAVDSE